MNKVDYIMTVNIMIQVGIQHGKYRIKNDATQEDLEIFSKFSLL